MEGYLEQVQQLLVWLKFADSLRLNSGSGHSSNSLNRLNTQKKGSMFNLGDNSDSDDEDNEVDDFFGKSDNSKVDLSFLTKTTSSNSISNKFGSGVLLNNQNEHVEDSSNNNSFSSGSVVSLSDASGSQSDLRENTLSRIKTRTDSTRSLSSMNLMNASQKSAQVNNFRHNLSQPPKRSFSLFADGDSDSDDD